MQVKVNIKLWINGYQINNSDLWSAAAWREWWEDPAWQQSAGTPGGSWTGPVETITLFWNLPSLCWSDPSRLQPRMTLLNPHLTSWQCKCWFSVQHVLDRKCYNSKVETLWSTKWVVSTYHQVFKFPVKLFELAGKFLWKQMTLKVNLKLG